MESATRGLYNPSYIRKLDKSQIPTCPIMGVEALIGARPIRPIPRGRRDPFADIDQCTNVQMKSGGLI